MTYVSNYPFGALLDPHAPWNAEDAKPSAHWVTLSVRIDAVDSDHAVELVDAWLKSAKIGGVAIGKCDYQIDEVIKDE
jgi:hypothetical protein